MVKRLGLALCMLCWSSYFLVAQDVPTNDTWSSVLEQYTKLGDSKRLYPDISPNALQTKQRTLERLYDSCDSLAKLELAGINPIDLKLLQFEINNALSDIRYETHLMPISSEGGFVTALLYQVRGKQLDKEADMLTYLNQLSGLPDYIDQQITYLQEGMDKGMMMPKIIVDRMMEHVDGILRSGPEASFLLDPLSNTSRLDEGLAIIKSDVFPALQSLATFLDQTYKPSAPEAVGIGAIEGGKAYYEDRVRYFTTFDITPKEVFETGHQEVARIKAEMMAIIEDLAFDGDLQDFIHFLRTDPQFYAETPAQLLMEAAWVTKQMEGMLPSYFNVLPRMPLTVVPVPENIAPNYTAGRYSPGSYTNGKAGEYWVNTYDLPSRPLYALPALSLHEGVPGHHTQIMLAAEMTAMPDFRRQMYISAFGEGWALYTEYLGEEAGIYDSPYKRFGRLTYEMWRACRLVVDPGLHYFGWTREEAIKFMVENTALSIREVNSEIDRYIGWPGQAVSYKMGELKIRELRKKAELALGDDFDIREFHDTLLSNGSVTMDILESMITDYINNKH